MQELTVIGIENGALVVASETGERYRVAIDDVLQSRLRQSTTPAETGVKVSPREIQAQIRAGMSAEDVARSTGASLEYVQRFEGPVLAERLHIVNSALRVSVAIKSADPLRNDPLGDEPSSTFGEVIEERLDGLGATDLRWASWKEETGWVVKLTFTASEIDHDARWQYDAKRHFLAPLNSGAVTLSQHGEIVDGLIPRLRAVDPGLTDARRIETAGLDIEALDTAIEQHETPAAEDAAAASLSTESGGVEPVLVEPVPFSRPPFSRTPFTEQESSPAAAAAAVTREAPGPAAHNETADLLEALRRRRGEREAASFTLDDGEFDDGGGLASAGGGAPGSGRYGHPSHGARGGVDTGDGAETRPVAHLRTVDTGLIVEDTPLDGLDEVSTSSGQSVLGEPAGVTASPAPRTPERNQTGPQSRAKRRTAMPSWDEIVFGARSDDDIS